MIQMLTEAWETFYSEVNDVATNAEKRVKKYNKINPLVAAICKND
jgi:hypothetical protein